MKKNFCKVRRGHCLSLVWIVSFLLWGNVTMAALPIQEAKLSIQQRSVALSRVFYEIEKQTGYSFLVRNNDINMNEKVSIDVKNKSVEEVLEMLFVGKNIRYKVEGEHISVYKPQQSRQNAITGLVMDVAKEPVIGASVVVMGSTNGCITDFDGKFSLEVSEFPVKLQISYIGYKSQEVTVRDTKTIQVVLREDTETLDEVVVVGYGTKKNKKSTTAGNVVTVKEQAKKEITPQPVIGKRSYQKYLKENLVHPTDEKCKDIKGEVVLSFFVDEEGKPQNITVIHGICEFADKEAIRLIKEGPKWTSGKLPARVTVRF